MLPYSSGTTGKPKGVMLTHTNILANVHQLIAAMGRKRQDVLVNVFPLYHAAGLPCILNSHLTVGATVVLMKRFDLEGWLALIQQYRGNICFDAAGGVGGRQISLVGPLPARFPSKPRFVAPLPRRRLAKGIRGPYRTGTAPDLGNDRGDCSPLVRRK